MITPDMEKHFQTCRKIYLLVRCTSSFVLIQTLDSHVHSTLMQMVTALLLRAMPWHPIEYRYRSDDITKKTFFFFFCMSAFWIVPCIQWSMMKNINSPNLVGIGSWGPEIWPHDYLIISPIEISVNWLGSKQLWTRPIYGWFVGKCLISGFFFQNFQT